LSDLTASEQRLLAHLDGLLTGEAEAYKLLLPKFVQGERGEVFAWRTCARDSRRDLARAVGPHVFRQCAGAGTRRAVRGAAACAALGECDRSGCPWFTRRRAPLRAAALDVLGFRRDPAVMPFGCAHWLDDPEPAVRAPRVPRRDNCVTIRCANALSVS